MKKIFKCTAALLMCLSAFQLSAQRVDCKDRLMRDISFQNPNDPSATVWSFEDTGISSYDFTFDTEAYNYTPTGFTGLKTPAGGSNNTKRQYAIVKNPHDLNSQFANINTDGILVINPLQGEEDNYFTINVGALVAGQDYYIELKLYNLVSLDCPNGNCCSSTGGNCWSNFDNAFRVDGNNTVFNCNNAGDKGPAQDLKWTNSKGQNGDWNAWGNPIYDAFVPSIDGTSVTLTGRVHVPDGCGDFKISFKKAGNTENQPIVLGVDYLKIKGCEEEKIQTSTGSTKVCEYDPIKLTAMGIGSANGTYKWYKNGTQIAGATTKTISTEAPAGGAEDTYKAVGEYNELSITLRGATCCGSGDKVMVFNETFPMTGALGCDGQFRDFPPDGGEPGAKYSWAGKNCKICDTRCAGYGYAVGGAQYAVVDVLNKGGWWPCYDNANQQPVKYSHTNDGSGFLIVNANPDGGSDADYFYKRYLTSVCPGTTYEFSAYVASIQNGPGEGGGRVRFKIYEGDKMIEQSDDVDLGNLSGWVQVKVLFTTPNSGSNYNVRIVNTQTGDAGNDLAIDDITVSKCLLKVNLLYGDESNLEVCTEDPIRITATMPGNGDLASKLGSTPYYKWQKSTDLTNWTDIGASTTNASYDAIPTETKTFYRAKIGSQGTIDLPISATECRADTYTEIFSLVKSGNITLNINDTKTQEICEGDPIKNISLSWKNANVEVTGLPKGLSVGDLSAYASGSATISGTPQESGTITVAAVNDNGCEVPPESITINVNPIPQLSLPEDAKSKIMINTSVQLISTVAGGTWESSDKNTATVNNSGVVTAASSLGVDASRKVTITYTSPSGCKATFDLEIVSYGPMGDDETYNYCKNEPKDIVLNGTGENITRYEWYLDNLGGTPFKAGEGMNDTYTVNTTGMTGNHIYYYRGCNGSSSANCAEQAFYINQTPDFEITISPSELHACANQSAVISFKKKGLKNEQYVMNLSEGFSKREEQTATDYKFFVFADDSADGIVTITASADGYCANTSNEVTLSFGKLTVDAQSDIDYICEDADNKVNANIKLTITADHFPVGSVQMIKWFKNGVEQTSLKDRDEISVAEAGEYAASVSYVYNGEPICEEVKIVNIRSEKLNVGEDKSYERCVGNEIALEGQGDGTAYKWTLPDGSENTTAGKKLNVGKIDEAGKYDYIFTVTKLTCEASRKHSVTMKAYVDFEIKDVATVCKDEKKTVSIESKVPSGGAEYTWDDGSKISTGSMFQLPATAGQTGKEIKVTGKANGYCDTEKTFKYDISELNLTTNWRDYFCPKESFDLRADVEEKGTYSTIEYTWTENGSMSVATGATASFQPDASENIAVEVTNGYCTKNYSKTIKMVDIEIGFEEEVAVSCPGTEVELKAKVSDGSASVDWSREDQETMIVKNIGSGKSIKDTPEHTSVYTASLTNKGCRNEAQILVEIFPAPVIENILSIEPAPKTIQILASGGTAPYTYSVDKRDYTTGDIFYDVRVGRHTAYVVDENNCKTSYVFTVEPLPLSFPLYFTPNGDGLNDSWIVKNLDTYEEVDLRIYDRFGKELIHITDPLKAWDGTYLDKKLPSSDYWYVLHIKEIGKTYTGHVTLVN